MRAGDENLAQFRKAFRRRKKIRLGIFFSALVLMIGVAVLAFPSWVLFGLPKGVWAPFFYLVMFALIGSIALVWKCPACGALLGDVFTTNGARHQPEVLAAEDKSAQLMPDASTRLKSTVCICRHPVDSPWRSVSNPALRL